jgi:N-methylhydantoinase A
METGLSELGAACPLLLMMSSGGITTVETARRFPVRLVESGPAGGAILARQVAARNGYDRALAFDMGGTTAKLTLIDDYTPQQSRQFEVDRAYRFVRGSGIPVRIPVIDMVEIGAGGGSIARVDMLRRIAVGPDSAGSQPGPACYGRGGTNATVTDADVVLGRIDPVRFAGGKVAVDGAKARGAVMQSVGDTLGMTPEEAARGITEIVDETMASAARVHTVESGKETGGRTLIAFGGAAPLHAVRLAEKLGITRILIPADAGVGSAIGFLDAPIAYEVVRTKLARIETLDADTIASVFDDMRGEAEAVVRLGAPGAVLEETRTVFMRYRGQGHEIPVVLSADAVIDPQTLRTAFDKAYAQRYDRVVPGLQVEALTWVLALSEATSLPACAASLPDHDAGQPGGNQSLVDAATGQITQATTYSRMTLKPGARLMGPSIVQEDGTSTVVPAGYSLKVGAAGDLVIELAAASIIGGMAI